MKSDILLLGLKRKVTAFSRQDGRQLWSTDLDGMAGTGLVTLMSDESRVYAYAGGHLHCLDLATGTRLWSNDLPGLGYGLGTLCLPGLGASPSPAAMAAMLNSQNASSASAASAASAGS